MNLRPTCAGLGKNKGGTHCKAVINHHSSNTVVMLMAAKHGLKVCPHAGGVGLCEYVQHLSMIDYLCIAGTREGRVIEYVDHLHEHFIEPCIIKDAAYMPPSLPDRKSVV